MELRIIHIGPFRKQLDFWRILPYVIALFEIFKETFYPRKKGNLMSYDTL